MNKHIVLICNTCPFGGETFLQNELRNVPENRKVELIPIFQDVNATQSVDLPENITVHRFETPWSILEKVRAITRSVCKLLVEGEINETVKKPNPIRNILKAIKFAYIGELRIPRIQKMIESNGYLNDEIVFYSYWLYEAAYIAARLKKVFLNSCFISRCHGFDLYEIRHTNGYLPYRKYLLRTANAIYPISVDGKHYLHHMYHGIFDEKVHVMRLGTDDYGKNPDENYDKPVIVSCSNMVEVKRIDRIVEYLKDYNKPLRWFHFGDGELRERLEKEAQMLPMNIDWMFMGMLPNNKLMQFYHEHHVDAFLNVSASEGVPVSIMEALSFGIPAIATNVGGTSEIVFDKENGVLLSPEFDKWELFDALDYVLRKGSILRKRARESWKQISNADMCYEMFYEHINKVF